MALHEEAEVDPDEPTRLGTYRGETARSGRKTYLWDGKRWRRAEEIVVTTPDISPQPKLPNE